MGIIATAATSMGSMIAGGAGSAMTWLGGTSAGMSNAGLLGMGTSLLSSLGGSRSQRAQAKAMEKAQEAEWQQRLSDTRENYAQAAQAEQAYNQEYRDDLMQNQISLAQQKAQVELMAGASGTGGQSITAMMTDLSASAGRNQATIVQNFENQQTSVSNQMRAIQKGGAVEKRKFEKPSAFSTITSALGAGAGGYLTGAKTGRELSSAYTSSRRGTNVKLS